MSPVHTRTNGRPRHFLRHRMYYKPKSRKRTRDRKTAASQIAKMIRRGRAPSSSVATRQQNTQNQPAANVVRRSLRKRRPANHNTEYVSFSDNEDDFDLTRRPYKQSRKTEAKSSQDEALPRREGLRPRRSTRRLRSASPQSTEDEDQVFSEEDEDAKVDAEEEDGSEENEVEDKEEEEDEEVEGRRRYALRNRSEVQRFSSQNEEKPVQPQRSMSKPFTFRSGVKRKRPSKSEKRHHRSSRADDSDDSLLIDEIVQTQGTPWLKPGSAPGPSWLFGGVDMSGFQNRGGLNTAGAVWGHQGDQWANAVPTAGLSHKGGADIQPLHVDESVTFDQVGGLSQYVQSLKEIVFFPLLYPKFFQNYGIKPPRGVLLCGPPGTGKTLIARALAASASRAGQKINFYMRKGADVLSKWVGEAERQLRMLFEEAQRNQPSIIFFDEIDGLAPVRSSKQEQIHNSIVSTLLALMDGLDALGQVIVIGATNRVDAIDGALRRPGRFDRELTFSLPDSKAREEILKIHTKPWKEKPSDDLCKELADACVGYCGADIKALCTEAAIGAFRKKYPQVYTSDDPLLVDVGSVQVKRLDFLEAMSTITPAAQRGTLVQSMPLSAIVSPCLENQLNQIMDMIAGIFPMNKVEKTSRFSADKDGVDQLAAFSTLRYGSSFPFVYRPKLLICGKEAAGIEHIGPAVLHELEKFPVHSLALPSLLSDMGSRSPEEALVNIFRESRRTTPAVLYLPQIELWWETANSQLRAVLLMLISELPSNLPVLFLATSRVPQEELDESIISIFGRSIYEVEYPTSEDRAKFFSHLLETAIDIFEQKYQEKRKPASPPELPKAPKQERQKSEAELQAQYEEEQHILRRMRMCLREVCNRLLYEKTFSVFHFPVTEEEAPDYHTIIQNPMDVSTLLQHTDSGHYLTRSAFLQDLELIPQNAKAYHKDDYNGARIVSKACALRDAAHTMLSQIDKDLVTQCDAIAARGGPLKLNETEVVGVHNPQATQSTQVPRVSARLRGAQPEINVSQTAEIHSRRSRRSSEGDNGVDDGNGNSHQDAELPTSPSLQQVTSVELNGQRELAVQLTLENEKEDAGAHSEARTIVIPDSPDLGGKDSFVDHFDDNDEMDVDPEPLVLKSPNHIENLRKRFVKRTRGFGISDLEVLHAKVCQEVRRNSDLENRYWVLKFLKSFISTMKPDGSPKSTEN